MISCQGHSQMTIAISTSDSPDMAALGLSEAHLQHAVADLAIYLLASGASLAYGGDLRQGGFTKLLFELVMRYRLQEEGEEGVINYLAWPVPYTHDFMRSRQLKH